MYVPCTIQKCDSRCLSANFHCFRVKVEETNTESEEIGEIHTSIYHDFKSHKLSDNDWTIHIAFNVWTCISHTQIHKHSATLIDCFGNNGQSNATQPIPFAFFSRFDLFFSWFLHTVVLCVKCESCGMNCLISSATVKSTNEVINFGRIYIECGARIQKKKNNCIFNTAI